MPSYLTTLVTTRYASLRSLLPANSETDGDTEDDTHICRVLRAYYVEKGRPFPTWLPPDPKAPQPTIQPIYSTNPVGSGYGGLSSGPGGASKLGSLWDSQPPASQSPGLRQTGGRGAPAQALRGGRDDTSNRAPPEPTVQARPLPSQLAGSYQNSSIPRSSGSAGTSPASAQDRLKARLRGPARAGTPGGSVGAQTQSVGSTASSGKNMGYGSAYGNQGLRDSNKPTGGGGGRPFVAATSPWVTNEVEFSGSGYSDGITQNEDPYGVGQQPPRVGGPRPGRRDGLPVGPRSTR